MVTVDEVRGWSRLTAAVAGRVILPAVSGMHRAITDGAFRWTGPLGHPVRAIHDQIVRGMYDAAQIAFHAAGDVGASLAERIGEADAEASPAAVKARAVAHGVLAQELLEGSPELDLEFTLRRSGSVVAPDRTSLQSAYPGATGSLVVFVHGLVDSEATWALAEPGDTSLPTVAETAGSTSLLVRYGTGRAVGRNGADLARLLEDVVHHWPVPVERIVVVGHSMGGLVSRAACQTAQAQDHAWLPLLSDVVYLGTPHLGSWLEKAANVSGWVLRQVSPQTAPLATLLEQRSQGIKDLRHGTLVEDVGSVAVADDLLSGLVPDEPWLDGVTHHLVVGRLRPSAAHPLNAVFGDLLVRSRSAVGAGSHRRIGEGGPVVVREVDATHTALARHPAVGSLLSTLAVP